MEQRINNKIDNKIDNKKKRTKNTKQNKSNKNTTNEECIPKVVEPEVVGFENTQKKGYNLLDRDSLRGALILSEIIGKPVCKRRDRNRAGRI